MKMLTLNPIVGALTLAFSLSAWAQTPAAEPSLPYTVTSRDKLITLSRDMLVQPSAWAEVAKFNKLKNLIRPGQVIQVPLRLLKFQPGQARVVSTTGNVQLGGSPMAVGASVPEGGKIQTGADSSAVVELVDGTRVKVLPNSLAEVVSNRDYAMRDASKSGSTTWFSGLIRLAQGVLETTATRTQNRATPLQVETPTSLVGVRGTQFRVAYEDPVKKDSRTEVVEGLVRADNTAQNSGVDLPKGTGAVINPAQREVRVVTLLAAPDLSALPAEVSRPQGQWPMPALAGAVAYRVQIAGDEQFNGIVRDIKVTGRTVDLGSLDTTRWYARIRGIDAQGLEGLDSVKQVAVLAPPPPPPPTPPPPPPPPPARFSVTGSNLSHAGGSNQLSWSVERSDGQPVAGVSYQIDLATNAAFNEGVARVQATEGKAALGALKPGQTYHLRLRATLADGKVMEGGDYQMTLSRNWGLTVLESMFPLVATGKR